MSNAGRHIVSGERRSLHKGRPSTGRRPGRPRTSINPNGTTAKGYGIEHKRLRAQWAPLVAAGLVRCAIGGERLKPGVKWHLAHADRPDAHERGLYIGPACAEHNNGTNRRQMPKRQPTAADRFFDTTQPR